MILPYRLGPGSADDGTELNRHRALAKESPMKWETPEATDMRFGMEITMYIANR
jgi:coenzyme PQQ precursor peptide PqqA